MEVPAGDSLVAVASQPGRNKTGLDTEESEQINLEMAAVEKNIDVLRTEMQQMQKEEEEIEELVVNKELTSHLNEVPKVEVQVDIETIVE